MSRLGFRLNQNICIGCNACQMACKDHHNLENGMFFRRSDTMAIKTEDGNTKYLHFSGACNHCGDAACIRSCKCKAIQRREDGTVVIRQEKCVGCGACVRACPYRAISLSQRTGLAMKCDSCYDLRCKGKEPVCVSACLTRALTFGEVEPGLGDMPFLPSQMITQPALEIHTEHLTDRKPNRRSCEPFMVNPVQPYAGRRPQQGKQGLKNEENLAESTDRPFDFQTGQEKTVHGPSDSESEDFLMLAAEFFRGWNPEIVRGFADWNSHSVSEWKLMYDYLFRGTSSLVSVPIWASTALGEKALLNQTTLAMIKLYHRFGYEPVWIEGNPPDYIGEQLLFLLHLQNYAASGGKITDAIQELVETYLLPTARMVEQAVSEWEESYEGFRECLKKLVSELEELAVKPEMLAVEMEKPDMIPEAIPDKPVHTIRTGGLNNCGGICVICPTVQENCMLSISTDDSSNAPQLRACVRGRGYRKTFLNPTRLRYPMKRVGARGSGKFERISWDEAVELLYQNWIRIRDTYGPGARYLMYGTGVEGIMRPGKMLKRLLSLDGGYLDYFNSYSSACVNAVTPYLFGNGMAGNSAADLMNTKLLLLWADNTTESIFGPERNYYLARLKEQGVKIVCIDPRLSQTGVAYADEWYGIRPSTDAALCDAMAYVIWSEQLQNQKFMDTYCLGFDEEHMPEGVPCGESYHSYIFGVKDGIEKTPEWAEGICGISADRIRKLARLYATTHPACISAGLGAQRHANGEQSARGIIMLSCLTGNVGIPGGGTGANASFFCEHKDIALFTEQAKNPYKAEIPTFLWTKAIEHGTEMTPKTDRIRGAERLDSNIKMIFNIASNILINQHSDINDTIRILSDDTKCEFIVGSDIFLNPSMRYCDLVLPATSLFEGENIAHSWAGSNYFLKNNPCIRPFFECRFEWDWIKELAEKLGLYEELIDGKPEVRDWLTENYEILRSQEPELPDYETFSRLGGWQFKDPICCVAYEKEIADPKGHPFETPSGKIEIFSKTLYDMEERDTVPAIPRYLPAPEGPEDELRARYPLSLIGWHTRRRCHSIHDNNEWQDEVEMPGLWIHPEDAAARSIENSQLVEVYNDRGRVRIPAIVTERIVKGCTAMSQGGWYTPDSEGTDTRGCINTLTNTSHPTPLAKGNPQHTNLVEVVGV